MDEIWIVLEMFGGYENILPVQSEDGETLTFQSRKEAADYAGINCQDGYPVKVFPREE